MRCKRAKADLPVRKERLELQHDFEDAFRNGYRFSFRVWFF